MHRNVANVVVHTDLNVLSVLQYGIEVLKVEHVLVVGHYGCGGVRAAAGNQGNVQLGLIDNWLRHVQVCGVFVIVAFALRAFKTLEYMLDDAHMMAPRRQDVRDKHATQLSNISTEEARLDRLCELNVIEQVFHVGRTTIVKVCVCARGDVMMPGVML